MEYFKQCPKCGRYMTPHLQYKFGYSYTLWICPCGYSEDIGDTRVDNKTTYTGGGASDRTIYWKSKWKKYGE